MRDRNYELREFSIHISVNIDNSRVNGGTRSRTPSLLLDSIYLYFPKNHNSRKPTEIMHIFMNEWNFLNFSSFPHIFFSLQDKFSLAFFSVSFVLYVYCLLFIFFPFILLANSFIFFVSCFLIFDFSHCFSYF